MKHKRIGLVSILLGLSLGYPFGLLEKLADVAGHNAIRAEAIEYIQDTLEEKAATLLVLEGAYQVLSMAESSQGGISLGVEFEVQIGKTLSSFVESVEDTRDGIITTIEVLMGTEIILELAPYVAAPILDSFFWLLVTFVVLSLVFVRESWLHRLLKALLELCLVVGGLLYCVLPYGLWAAGKISGDALSAPASEHHQAIHDALGGEALEPHSESKHRVKWVKEKLAEFESGGSDAWSDIKSNMESVVIYSVVETVILPLFALIFGAILIRIIIKHTLQRTSEVLLRDQIELSKQIAQEAQHPSD